MTRALALSAVASAALLAAVPADAAPQLPVKLVAEPGSCQAPYYEIGWVGVEGARWRVCQRNPLLERPI